MTSSPAPVPELRIRARNARPARRAGRHVVYWMTACRRATRNFALQRALEHAARLDRPLVVLEPLRVAYPFACARFHRFVIEGMRANRAALSGQRVHYHPYVEPRPAAGSGLLEALARDAAVVVTDEYPAFFLPRLVDAAARRLDVLLESVDSNGLLPLAATDEPFPSAYAFRRTLQKLLPAHLGAFPSARPFEDVELPAPGDLSPDIHARWPRASEALLDLDPGEFARLPIDHGVGPVERAGGSARAERELVDFVRHRLPRYATERSEPASEAASGLSPWLHFGHLSPHAILAEIATAEGWSPAAIGPSTAGRKAGWWGLGASAEAFLDELVTWRELGFHFAARRADAARYESLPEWSRRTLDEHARDPRPYVYSLAELEGARTHDRLWNAAQTQLVRDGRIHNYLRMLWGKKILHWTPDPRTAHQILFHLNDKYALDGRDPNTTSGIAWVLGRFDRPWGPVRPVFGTVRYMTSENTARKFDVEPYVARWAPTRALTSAM